MLRAAVSDELYELCRMITCGCCASIEVTSSPVCGLVLTHCGTGFENVVKVVVYLMDVNARPAINAVRKRHFGDARPASTLVEVSALAHAEALVEIEAVAHLGWR